MHYVSPLAGLLNFELFYIHRCVKRDHDMWRCFPECYCVVFGDFYRGGFIQPHAVLQHNSTLTAETLGTFVLCFFSALLVCCAFLSSLISCVEGAASC